MQQHIDKSFGDKRFRIERFDARTGSWIVFQLLAKIAPIILSGQMNPKTALLMAGTVLTQQEFAQVQRECLNVCYVYEEKEPSIYLPLMKDANYLRKELAHEITLTIALTVATLEHNLGSFFTEDGLKSLTEMLGLNSSTSQPSADSSSVLS